MKTREQKSIIDLSYYTGKWVNSYDKARVLSALSISEKDGKIEISPENAATGFYTGTWGSSALKPYAYGPETNDIVAFQAHFKMEDMEAFLAVNENKGLLIIAGYFSFKENDNRSDCFVREFFYKI